jgi:phosphoribosylamine--glycine ligase
MRVMVVGSGAREHALAWALSRSTDYSSARPGKERIFCAPGNAGTEGVARNVAIDPQDGEAVVRACQELGIGLVIVGPEGALAAGLVDALDSAGIRTFGPRRAAAMLESNKAYARSFAERYGIPCARTDRFKDREAFIRFLDQMHGQKLVLKKSGLASGKGVFESDSRESLRRFGESVLESDELLAEEFLVGKELSIFALCDLGDRLIFPACADHKKAGSGDSGPNTGGMGAVCPVPFADAALMKRIEREIIDPTFRGMDIENLNYRGVLFFGIMVTAQGPRLLEYNVRFGDPETQSLLPLLESNFLDLCAGTAGGRLCSLRPSSSDRIACGVVIAAPGYPGDYPKGLAVDLGKIEAETEAGIPEIVSSVPRAEALLFHASTARDPDGRLRTTGGRCFTAVGLGETWEAARDSAYATAEAVKFEGAWYRPDIGDAYYPR